MLKKVKSLFPSPKRILFMGASAGGLGVIWNLPALRQTYPTTPIVAVNDGGVPLSPPHVKLSTLQEMYTNWGALDYHPATRSRPFPTDIQATLIRYNQLHYPDVKFALLAGYEDVVMTYFAKLMGGVDFTKSVQRSLIQLADGALSESHNSKVYYFSSWHHVISLIAPETFVSDGVSVSDWMAGMLGLTSHWSDVRPEVQ